MCNVQCAMCNVECAMPGETYYVETKFWVEVRAAVANQAALGHSVEWTGLVGGEEGFGTGPSICPFPGTNFNPHVLPTAP